MSAANYSINHNAVASGSSGDGSMGMAVLWTVDGYLPATAANRATYSRRADGIALEAFEAGQAFRVAHGDMVDAGILDIGAGTATWIIVSSDGTLERKATLAGGDDCVGKCTVTGDLHLQPNTWDDTNYAGGGGGGGGDASYPIDLTDSAQVTVPAAGVVKSDGSVLSSSDVDLTADVTGVLPGDQVALADDIAAEGGANINRVKGINRVPLLTHTGAAVADGAKPPIGGAWVRNQAFGVDGFRAKRPTPHGWFDAADYGAIGDGASHPLSGYFGSLGAAQAVFPHATSLTNELDWAAIQAAINAATTAEAKAGGADSIGGQVHIGRGHFLCDQPLSCAATRGLKIAGSGQGVIGTGVAWDSASVLMYTGTGARFIDARSSYCFALEDIAVTYNSTSFLGHLVDFSHFSVTDSSQGTVRNCTLSGAINIDVSLGQGCKSLLFLGNVISSLVDNCVFTVARQGIRFRDGDGSYSNAHRVRNCQFVFLEYSMTNGGQNIHVSGCTFEGIGGIMIAAYADEFPQTRATGGAQLTYTGSKITRPSGSFVTDGYRVGYTVGSIHAVGVGNISIYGFPQPLVRVTATELDFTANDITLDGDEIQRSYGSFIDDGWEVGMQPTLALTGCGFNGEQGAITNVTATELTISGAAYGAPVAYDEGSVYHITEAAFDARTMASDGLTFSEETSEDAFVFVLGSGGPISFHGCWFGDRYNDGAWLRFQNVTGLSLVGNFISTSAADGYIVDTQFSAAGAVVEGNYFQSSSSPLQFGTEDYPVVCAVDGLVVQGNFGDFGANPLFTWPLGIVANGIVRGGNGGDETEATVDMDNADASIDWSGKFASEIIKVTSTTPFAADRTLTVPGSSNAGAVKRFVRNAQAGAFAVIVSTGAGTSVDIAQGKGAWVGIDAGGVFRMGADV